MFEHFHGDPAYVEQIFCCEVSEIFCHKMFTMVLLDGILDGFSNFWLFILENCILIWPFRVLFRKLYISMHWLSICENDFINCWGKDFNCTLSLHRMSMLSQSTNFDSFYMDIQTHAELTRQFRPLLSWAYKETIPSLAEPMGKQFHRLLSQRGNGVNWMMVNPSRLRRRRLVCTGGDSSTEGETCLQRMGDKELIRETGDGR
jgi:hypothetical protein